MPPGSPQGPQPDDLPEDSSAPAMSPGKSRNPESPEVWRGCDNAVSSPRESPRRNACLTGAPKNFRATLAQLLAKQSIRVNTLASGPIWTSLIPSKMPAEKAADFGSNTLLCRPGQSAELAHVYVFSLPNRRVLSPAPFYRSPAAADALKGGR
jgi:hypothetical protein